MVAARSAASFTPSASLQMTSVESFEAGSSPFQRAGS